MLAFPSHAARDKAWQEFGRDPEWQTAQKASEVNGKLLAKAPESRLLHATDFSPAPDAAKTTAAGDRVFELRTYTASPGKLDALNARFRDHTCKLFERHGMANVGYWTPLKGQKGDDVTLVYILAHKDMDAAKASWAGFRGDADWTAARKASEEKAGGSLTAANGVKSVYMKPTDYSPMK